jgi:hypothetical protein
MKEHIKNVVLVHGAFADGSGWDAVANILKKDGYKVSVVQHPRLPTRRTKSIRRRQSTPWTGRWFWWATVMAGPSSPKPAIIQTLRRLSILPHLRSMKVRAVRRSSNGLAASLQGVQAGQQRQLVDRAGPFRGRLRCGHSAGPGGVHGYLAGADLHRRVHPQGHVARLEDQAHLVHGGHLRPVDQSRYRSG